jgi:MFS family permease
MAGFALGNWVIGRWVDRYGAARVLAAAALILAASFAGAAAAPNIATLSALQFIVGFATAASFGPLIADVSQWFLRRRGIAVAIIASGNYLSGAFWPLVLADVLAGPGWRTAYLIIAASALLVMLPLTYALRKPLPEEALQTSAAAAALKARETGMSNTRSCGSWRSPGSAAAWRCPCRRSISWPIAWTSATAPRWGPRCCR